MRLTAKELEQMKSVDIGAVAPESLPDVSGMAFDTSLPREERIALFLPVSTSRQSVPRRRHPCCPARAEV